jgi:hypothetical protein
MPKRAPPGRYEVRAARQTLQNPLEMIVDMQRTKQEIENRVGPGQLSGELRAGVEVADRPAERPGLRGRVRANRCHRGAKAVCM